MFGVVDHTNTQYNTGLYFPEYPSLPMQDGGTRFRYREQIKSARMSDVVAMLSNESTQKIIMTNYRLDFKVEGYVLLGSVLYRIMDVSSVAVSPQTARFIKRPMIEQTLTLNRVSNALGLEI